MNVRADTANRQVGRSVPRLEGPEKVSGRASYVHNMSVPGMLYAKVVRSTVAHGRILSIDASGAFEISGVEHVFTGSDVQKIVPDPYFGPAFHDQPVLAIDKVHFVGEPVAVVLARDPYVAAEAAQQIWVDYEELPAVFDEVEAMKPDVVVHDELKPAGTFPDLKHLIGRRNTNIALDYHLKRGDPERAFAQAAHVFEHEFRSQQVMHVPLEPMVALAVVSHDTMTIHTASQSPSFVRTEIARLLGWSENRVKVKVPFLGGGFGAKLYIKLEALVACAALLARAPVKLMLTMEEQFYTITKHASTFRIRSGVNSEGRLIARHCEVLWNGGAFADIGPRVTQKSGFTAPGPYDIDNVSIDSYALYTNRPPAGALRGFGIPQLVWAYESHTDMIAHELGVDPLAFRRKNILKGDRPQATGTSMKDAAVEGVLERIAERMDWSGKAHREPSGPGKRIGRGLAIGFKASIAPTTSVAIVTVSADGSTILQLSTVDMGQGSNTAMAQIVADIVGVATEDVKVVTPDTDVTPYDMATLGSRSTFHMGHAVRLAAEDVRAKLADMAKSVGESLATTERIGDLFKKKYGMQAGNAVGVGTYIPEYKSPDPETGQSDKITPFWMIGGTGVELEVDTETGKYRILRMINAADLGTPLNPKIVESQLSGAAMMQLGFTMFEEMRFDGGQVTNASLADYKIPGIQDVPQTMENEIVEAHQHNGPFGAKGVGESATFGVSPAIANALFDAAGVRITSLPITPEAVFHAIRAQEEGAG
ncbi:CO or xanthine dehydrogenase, Mo-binding subunit [Roseovarius pacificus]|uniref:CO or xanthine dehydrogenase, Mo-binding subunit n=1 Tax=Roseovarius pacificus TaxID=337701 RepID=A0A1M7A370_9RHOB|nr:xanthine dehydrogenase family protein molybdopterin-binding subunit [Roseovarius pacificus]GGO53938.1 aldehyde oxidase [Roseovarius pacificus]SHL37191.1 CO or xanthine dehydrogenase, Mo-binding subunit [Roseovarius pacificus]